MSKEEVLEKGLEVVGEKTENSKEAKDKAEKSNVPYERTYGFLEVLEREFQGILQLQNPVQAKILYAIRKNYNVLIAKKREIDMSLQKQLMECIKKKEDGSPEVDEERLKSNQFPFDFIDEDHAQKFQAFEKEQYEKDLGELKLHKVNKDDLLNIAIVPQRNPNFSILMEYMTK